MKPDSMNMCVQYSPFTCSKMKTELIVDYQSLLYGESVLKIKTQDECLNSILVAEGGPKPLYSPSGSPWYMG